MKEKARKDIRTDINTDIPQHHLILLSLLKIIIYSNCKNFNGIDTFTTVSTVKILGSLKVNTIPLLIADICETIYAWL